MDLGFLLDNTTLGILRRRLGVLGDDVNPLNQDLGLVGKYFQNFPGLLGILVVSGDNDYVVTFFDIKLGFESVAHLSDF